MRGRIFNTPALVLARQQYGEADRISVLYTREFGKLRIRFIGVDRPKGKLKALSEPMTHAEYRLYLRGGADFGIAAGGSLATIYPALRADLAATLRGLQVVELLDALTPFSSPNPEKYELATRALAELEKLARTTDRRGSADWVVGACALRLLESAGFGLRERQVSTENRGLWDALHREDLATVAALPADPALQRRLIRLISRMVEQVAERPLNSASIQDALIGAGAPA
ncbi:MAG: DNA repair protein RecO [Elusimicrobiota bacterium]